MLQGDKACLLVDADPENNSYEVIFPETGRGAVLLTQEDLQSLYGVDLGRGRNRIIRDFVATN